MLDEIKVVIRPPQESDKGFIMQRWLMGQYYGCSYFEHIQADLYYKYYTRVIKDILSNPEVKATVACDEQNPEWILGFAIFDDSIYWVHVKRDFRQRGIAKLLLKDHDFKVVKSTTRIGHAITKHKGLIFNPF